MEILGISLSDIGVKEALKRTLVYLEQGGLNTIAYISGKKLLEASENEEQQKWWKSVDLTIYEDVEVLKAAGEATQSRIKEVEENYYLKEVLRYLVRLQAPTFLLAEDSQRMETFERELRCLQSNLYVVGRDTSDHYEENKEGMINGINAMAPRVILSRLPYPEGIRLMYDYGKYLNGSLWLTLPEILVRDSNEGIGKKVSDLVYKKLLHQKINRFAKEQEEK